MNHNKLLAGNSSEIFCSQEENISITRLLIHFFSIDKYRCINNTLYFYNKEFGYLEKIDESKEALYINYFIEPYLRLKISTNTIEELIRRLKNNPEINLSLEDLNSNPYLINVKNGVYNLKTNELLEHNIKYLFSYYINANIMLNIDFIPSTIMEPFEKFVKSSLGSDRNKVFLLLEIIGYLASDIFNAKKAFMFIGKPHTGKSLLTKIITHLVGNSTVSNIPFHKLGDRFSIAELSQKKLNINAELNSNKINSLDYFKAITGNDFLTGEFKGEPLFSFKSKTKLLFAGNTMPNLKQLEFTNAFTDRLVFLIFNGEIRQENIDYDLENKLINIIDFIFTLSIRRLKLLIERNFKFTTPQDSLQFITTYSNNQNHILEFVNDYCNLGKDLRVHTKSLYDKYKIFCYKNCILPYKVTEFGSFIENINGITRSRFRLNKENLRGFLGISLKESLVNGTE